MPWARLDDSIYDNRKLLECAPAVRWLYIAAICYCRRNQTAGTLTRGQMASLLAGQKLRIAHVRPLLDHGLLWDTDYGYEIQAYEEFNPLTSTERVRKHRKTKHTETLPVVSKAATETPLARAPRAGSPEPVPQPVVISSSNVSLNSPEALAICHAFEGLGGVITPRALQDAEGLVAEFRIPSGDEFSRAMSEGSTRTVRTLTYFRQRFRELNDSLRDAGRKPRDHDWGGRLEGFGAVATSEVTG